MTDKLFNKLWLDALTQSNKEMYLSEYGYPNWFDEISQESDIVLNVLGNIHDVAHMSLKDMIKKSSLSQSQFAEKFCIPKRTIENWCSGVNKCPDYTRLMISRLLGYLEV